MNPQKADLKFKSPAYLHNLDGLRFMCFLWVFLYHSFHTEFDYIRESSAYEFVKWGLLPNGNLGVNFFFVLSGFLITRLLIAEREEYGRISVPNFWIRRMLRIWPLFYFCVFFGFIVFPVIKSVFGQVSSETANPWSYLLFFNNFDVIEKGLPDASILGVLWSVAIEEQFYIVWPLLLSILPVRHYQYLFLVILAVSLGFRAFTDSGTLNEFHTLSCIGDMVIGGFGALAARKAAIRKRIEDTPVYAWIVLYCVVMFVFFFRHELFLSNFFIRVIERPLIAFIFLLVILEQSFAGRSFYKMSRFRTISFLGTITYGLYCLHFIGILIATNATKMLKINDHLWQVMILETFIALALTIIFAIISYRYFESPFLALKNKFSLTPVNR